MRLGVVCGLAAEARLVRRRFGEVAVSGADPARAAALAAGLLEAGCRGLLSIGIAGGLAPEARPGLRIVPGTVIDGAATHRCDATLVAMLGGATATALAGSDRVVGTVAGKAALHRHTGAVAVDTESHAVARAAAAAGRPFAVLRVVADGAGDALPPAALLALTEDGRPRLAPILVSLLARPGQLPGLIRLAARTRAALAALERSLAGLDLG